MRAWLSDRTAVSMLFALALACGSTEGDDDGAAGAAGTHAASGGAGAPGAGSANAGHAGALGGGSAGAGGAGNGSGGSGAAGASGTTAGVASGSSGALNAGTGGAAGASAGSTGAAGSGGAPSAGAAGTGSGGVTGGSGGAGGAGGTGNAGPLALLVFSRTTGYRHEAIPAALQAIDTLAMERDWTVTATEDPELFNDAALAPIDVMVFLMNSGDDILDDTQQAAFERFIRAGRGFVGIHSASATESEWPFYGELVGAYFREHPDVQPATLLVEERGHPSTAHLDATWMRTDEWYAFITNPRDGVQVLLSLDEDSYEPGTSTMNGDHPVAWFHEYEGTRSFHTALGHTQASYTEAAFLEHIAGGIDWAGRR